MSTGAKRSTALFGTSAPDFFVGITPLAGRGDTTTVFEQPKPIFGKTNLGVRLFATVCAPEGGIGVGVPWRQTINPTAPHPKVATGGPGHKSPLLLANPTRGRAPRPKAGISYSFAFGAIDLEQINGGINGR